MIKKGGFGDFAEKMCNFHKKISKKLLKNTIK